MQARNWYFYAVLWISSISDKRLWSYRGDKVLIWRKNIKDGRHDQDIFPNFLKNWCSLGINTTMQYVEYWVYRISGFEVIRVTRSLFDEKRLKMAAMTQIFSRTFWKIDAV